MPRMHALLALAAPRARCSPRPLLPALAAPRARCSPRSLLPALAAPCARILRLVHCPAPSWGKERAARRAARTGAPPPSINLTPLALTSRRAARRSAESAADVEAERRGGGGAGSGAGAQPAKKKSNARARRSGRQQQQEQQARRRGARDAVVDGRVHRHDDEYRQVCRAAWRV